MTRPLSDAQLDAEAAAPPIPLGAIIAFHRHAYAADLFIPKLTTDSPPVTTDPNTGERREDEMSMLGPTLSHALYSWITEAYGTRFPWSRSRAAARDLCRRTHTRSDHFVRPEWRGSLCDALVVYTIIRGYSWERACLELWVSPRLTEGVARDAFATIERKMDELRLAPTPEPTPGRVTRPDPLDAQWHTTHRPLDGLHAAECPQCGSPS